MIFPLVVAVLTALALAVVLVPLLRRHRRAAARADYDLAVYRDQLKELESDRARGLVSEQQVGAARTEIERRMLRAAQARDADGEAGASEATAVRRRRAIAVGLGICIPALCVGLYWTLGAPGLPSRPFAEIEQPAGRSTAAHDVQASIDRLLARLEADPASLEGWLLLGRSYVVMQRYRDAVDALRSAAALSGGAPEIVAMLGEAMVWANDGVVVPDAVRAFREVLEVRPADPSARFHLALAQAQAGEVRQAYEMWLALAAETPADAPWRADLVTMIRQAADQLGVAVASIPKAPARGVPAGPTAEEVAEAAEMTPQDRMEMIRGMVEGLAARLERDPNDPEGWRRLARSYRVLGEEEKAAQAERRVAVLESRAAGEASTRSVPLPSAEDGAPMREISPEETAAMQQDVLDALQRAVELAPDDVGTLRAYAHAIVAASADPDRLPPLAVEVYERIIALDPDDPDALWFVGLGKLARGDGEAARRHWQRLLAHLQPGAPEHEAVQEAINAL